MARFAHAINERDVDGFGSMLHQDYVHHNHQRLRVQDISTRDDAVNLVRSMMTGGSASFEAIAVRDADLALGRLVTTFGPDLVSNITVLELRDGLIHEGASFDDDQLTAALADLDRRWVERGGPRAEIRNAIAFRNAQHAGDVQAARRLLSDDFVLTDHSNLGVGRLGVDEHLATAVAGASGVVAIPIEYLEHSDAAALARIQFGAPDDSVWEYWVVTQIDGGRTRSVDLFGIDDLDVARARFEELAPDVVDEQSLFSNHAWEVARAVGNALIAGDRTTAAGLHADTFESTSQELFDPRVRPDQETLFDFYLAEGQPAEGDVDVVQRLVATRGDSWCVWQISANFGSRATMERVCLSSAQDGQMLSTKRYELADLHDAMDELDRQWTVSGGRADPVVAAVARSMSNGPFDAYADCFAPDFVCVDHRALGFGVRSRDEWLDSTRSLGGQVTLTGAQEYLAVDDGISLSRVEMSSNILDSIWQFWLIDQHDGERAVRWEEFAIDQCSRALARYRELTRTVAPMSETPANAATRMIEENVAALNDGDLDRFRTAFHPEARHELRQRIRVEDVIDLDGIMRLGRSIIAGNGVLSSETLAIHGEQLAICRQVVKFGSDEVRECSIFEVEEGVISREIRFDEDRLVEALDTFSRRAAELGRPRALADIEVTIRDLHWRRDVHGFTQALDASWFFHDHRRLGLGRMTRDEYLASSFPVGPGEVLYSIVEVLAYDGSVWLAHDRWLTSDGSGWDNLHVGVFRSGLALSSDTFDLVDLDAARACYDARVTEAAGSLTDQRARPVRAWFDDLTSEVPVSRPRTFSNLAWEASRELVAAHSAGDRVRCASRLADDMVWVAHDPIMQFASPRSELDREGWLDVVFHEDLAGAGHVSTAELIAIRGETLCLHLTTATAANGDVTDRIYLVEIDVAGLCTRIDSFRTDQLREAYDELDRRYLETLPIDHETVVRASHWYTTDRDVFAEILHPRFRFRDHRKLAWPDADRDVMLEYIGTLPPGSYATVPEIFRVTDRDFVIRRVQFMEEGTANTDSIVVGQLDDGLLIEMDWYEPDDLDTALAHYEKRAETGAPLAPELANRGSAAGSRSERPGGARPRRGALVPPPRLPVRVTAWVGADVRRRRGRLPVCTVDLRGRRHRRRCHGGDRGSWRPPRTV